MVTQGPLALLGALYMMPNCLKRILTKHDPDREVKAEDHLDNLYLQLQTLKVQYDDVACKLFPCTLDGREAVWYHNLPINSIHKWGMFKRMFLENFVDDKTPTMLLKELGSLKMEAKEKVNDFNQRFLRIFKKFWVDTKPHESITLDSKRFHCQPALCSSSSELRNQHY